MGEYTHSRPLRLFEICAGYGSQALALERLRRDYPDFGFELAGWCECDPESSKPIDEQPAVIAHNALHPDGIGKNWGDLTKIDWEQVPDFDLLTASTPCQSISSAGLQHGFVKDSGTRSSIIWNVHDCVRVKRPRYILMENVSAILSDKFFPLLHLWMVELEHMGYTNFMPTPFTLQDGSTTRNGCLNSKHYGCPQNRERWFMVSILDCTAAYYFPKPFRLERRLKDVLEQNVAERYYLKEEQVEKLMAGLNKEIGDETCIINRPHGYFDGDINKEYSPAIAATEARVHKWVAEPQIDILGQLSSSQNSRIIGTEGISPAVINGEKDGMPKIVEPTIADMRGRDKNNPNDRGKSTENYAQLLEPKPDGTSNTITSVAKDNYLMEPGIRIRRLTERELYRLMDVDEKDIDTLMATDISKTSHSKLAGNSIVVSVLYHIFRTMFIDTVPIAGTQTILF